ncbi:MAG: hypothetical protein M0R80_00985 [Proteobacteria bacterium]|jgi:hypothetical protein|nr:hypothetical protein [Pseudomonadota bacterium]
MYKNKEDQKEFQRKHFQKNKAIFRDRNKNRKQANKLYVEQYKEAHACTCGESCVACLQLHHLGDKDTSVATAIQGFGLERLKKEIAKCEVVCANCHRKIHRNDCPPTTSNVKRQRNRAFVSEYRRTHCCEECGEKEECCLDFHHDGEKEINITRAVCDWGLPNLKKEIAKCKVLCANCHRKIHYHWAVRK